MNHNYLIYKSLHIVFIITYFSGIFYIVRLMIYHSDTQSKKYPEKKILSDQFIIMKKKLWNIIILPSSILLSYMGSSMLLNNKDLLYTKWMKLKIIFILLLIIYHYICWKILCQQKKNIFKYSSITLRIFNEIPLFILFIIISAAIQKETFFLHTYYNISIMIFAFIPIIGIIKTTNKKNK